MKGQRLGLEGFVARNNNELGGKPGATSPTACCFFCYKNFNGICGLTLICPHFVRRPELMAVIEKGFDTVGAELEAVHCARPWRSNEASPPQ